MYDTGKSIPAPLLNSGRVYHKALIDAADFFGAKCGRCRRLVDPQGRHSTGKAHQQDARSYYGDQVD
jgi:hypothetical protein